MPERLQIRRTKGWRMPLGAVNVSRPCDWSNPFRVGDLVRTVAPVVADEAQTVITRDLAVALFRAYVAERGWEGQIRAELAGKDLACWCRLDEPCHADVLLQLANGP